jgi:hypothetical protein
VTGENAALERLKEFFVFLRKKDKVVDKEKEDMVRGLLMAYSILIFHALLVCGLFFVIIFFQGLVRYMPWIFLTGGALIVYSGYRFLQSMKQKHQTLGDLLRDPLFEGRSVDLRLLGGAVEIKLGKPDKARVEAIEVKPKVCEIEDRSPERERELLRLDYLLERRLITKDEYNKAKKSVFE